MSEDKKPVSWLTVHAKIDQFDFECSVVEGEAVTFQVSRYQTEDDYENCEPRSQVTVDRDAFLAMFELAREQQRQDLLSHAEPANDEDDDEVPSWVR